jgi:glycosyltransferase involved in cell wall biosynthesis
VSGNSKGEKRVEQFFKQEQVASWFDIGLLLDRLKDNREEVKFPSLSRFKQALLSSPAFVTYDFGIDGVSVEIAKYCRALEKMAGDSRQKIYWIGGQFSSEMDTLLDPAWTAITIPELMGFNAWEGYQDFFGRQLERGDDHYNALVKQVWTQCEVITKHLDQLIDQHKLKVLITVNASSNPGNVPLALALAIISELRQIPVIGNHHDFYWESGKRKFDRAEGEAAGPRDHFFTNSHLGELFTLVETLYPWEGPLWTHAVINRQQQQTLIEQFGFNPNSLGVIPTSIDSTKYRVRDDDSRRNTLFRLYTIFINSGEEIEIAPAACYATKEAAAVLKGKPAILGNQDQLVGSRFFQASLLLLQPTRIIARKRIELDYDLIERLLQQDDVVEFLRENPQLTITMLITGPVAPGHDDYFHQLLVGFNQLLARVPAEFKDRIFLALSFGLESQKTLQDRGLKDVRIYEVYSVSSLVLLPSETEGRGLPLLESAAAGVPMVCNRYRPEHVYQDVLGDHLEQSQRIKVFDHVDGNFSGEMIDQVGELLIHPWSFEPQAEKNRAAVKKRFSRSSLVNFFDGAFEQLWSRTRTTKVESKRVQELLRQFKGTTKYGPKFDQLVLNQYRSYLPGLTRGEFLIYLKSLIDPNFFRLEEMQMRGRVFKFARHLISDYLVASKIAGDQRVDQFYRMVDQLYLYHHGKSKLVMDHSFSYRHRYRRSYPYRSLTLEELQGVVNMMFREIFPESLSYRLKGKRFGLFKTLKSALLELLDAPSQKFTIDDSERLTTDLKSNKNFAFFANRNITSKIQIFILNTMKSRLGISLYDEITSELIDKKGRDIGQITLLTRELPIGRISYQAIMEWLERDAMKELRLLYQAELFKVVPTKMLSGGIHLGQLGKEAMNSLLEIRESGGFVIAVNHYDYMIDMIDMPSYRIGKITRELMANFMGLSVGDLYLQWVPAGLKPSLAYPTPVQTPAQFSAALNGELFKQCVEQIGEERVLQRLREMADRFGPPIVNTLEEISRKGDETKGGVKFDPINGIHQDGLPWSGAQAVISTKEDAWSFSTAFSGGEAKTVLELVESYEQQQRQKVDLAWNGGYILNPELVGKLGLPSDYIGSPLGLIIQDGEVLSLPLYNKAAMLIGDQGDVSLERVNLKKGLTITFESGEEVVFGEKDRNRKRAIDGPLYYDLLYGEETISGKGRVIYRLVGNQIIESIIDSAEAVKIIPVGLTISLPLDYSTQHLRNGQRVKFIISELAGIKSAIEAGPMLVTKGKIDVDMDVEGWTTKNSIATQAARLDYLDMRGPKIGVGISAAGELMVVTINGRIRESVGATHLDLAKILEDMGATRGMGFDPGGSVTLLVDGEQLNITPYNPNYEQNVYSLPGVARSVGNAVLVTSKE